MKVLITGRSGSGKSTISRELERRDYTAFDGDSVPSLARWIDTKTGSRAALSPDALIDTSKTQWSWDKQVLERLMAEYQAFFLCGSAHNQLDFHGLFDKVFVLTLPPEIQRQRIISRAEHDYGKLPEMQNIIIAEQAAFVDQAVQLGATPIDATPTPAEIVTTILAQTYAR